MKRIYISGPMTGLPDNNYPAFHAAAKKLRAMGYDVVNPAENGLPKDTTWQAHMRADIMAMMTCNEVVCLPEWSDSRGAIIEVQLAISVGIKVSMSVEYF